MSNSRSTPGRKSFYKKSDLVRYLRLQRNQEGVPRTKGTDEIEASVLRKTEIGAHFPRAGKLERGKGKIVGFVDFFGKERVKLMKRKRKTSSGRK